MDRLAGKVALVTGAGSVGGLGDAIARRFVEEGAIVHLSDIDGEGAEARAGEIGGTATGRRQDVTSEEQWEATIADIVAREGRFDILVNNAGIAVQKRITDITPADFLRQMEVNVTSVYLGTRRGLAAMRAAGNGGAIVNMSSVAGIVGFPGASAYAASKGAVRLFSKAIAMEAAGDNIRVNTIHPGMIWTGMQKIAIAYDPKQFDVLTAGIPLKRMGEPVDIANAALFLASDEGRYVTGAEIVVDGGMTAQ